MASFTLTDSPDTLTGTGGADTFTGDAGTLQTADTITGGGGMDVLTAGVEQNGAQSPTIEGVERLFLDTGGLPFDISNIVGADLIFTDGASIVLEGVGSAALDTVFGGRKVESGTVKIQFEDGALSASDDRLNLSAVDSNVTFTSDSTFDSTPDFEDNPTEDRLRVEEIRLVLRGAENQVDISDFSAIEKLFLVGGADSKISLDAPDLERIIANGMTGDLTLTNDIEGDQFVVLGTGSDDVKTGSGADTIDAGRGDDTITAGGGDNKILGRDGNDSITAEAGNDTVFGGSGDDFMSTGSGDDSVNGAAGNDEIVAGDGADNIRGGFGDDDILGQGGADTIRDGFGADTVDGGGDDDLLIAGGGDDLLTGGGGVDEFRFRDDFGTDEVTDFTLTSSTSTNDIVSFEFEGGVVTLQSQAEFEQFDADNDAALDFDTNTDTVTIFADGGTIVLNVSDADFLA